MEKGSAAAPSFPQTGLLVGLCADSGYAYFDRGDADALLSEARGLVFLRTLVQNLFRYHRQKIYDILAYHYRDWERPKDPVALRDSLVSLVSDGLFAAPSIQAIRYHSGIAGAAPVFLHSFGHTPSNSRWEQAGRFHRSEMDFALGAPLVARAADGFGSFRSSTYTRMEKSVAEMILRYLTNFVKFG